MNIKTAPAAAGQGVRDVGTSHDVLQWDAVDVNLSLIVCGPFGVDAVIDQPIIDRLSGLGVGDLRDFGVPLRVDDERSIFIMRKTSIGTNAYDMTRVHVRYSVFGCRYERATDSLSIYVPKAKDAAFCDVSAVIKVRVQRQEASSGSGKGFLGLPRKGAADHAVGYAVRVQASTTIESKYSSPEGEIGLAYGFAGCDYSYPVTAAMLGARKFFVPGFDRGNGDVAAPELRSRDRGFKIINEG